MSSADSATDAGSLVGRRVRIAGNLATVRWGPGLLQAPPTKAPPSAAAAEGAAAAAGAEAVPAPSVVEVVGVEYDEAGFGKHDGTYQGERLFACQDGLGSFTKVEKVEFGISLQRAMAGKFFASLLPDAAVRGKRSEEVDAMEYVDSKGREKAMAVELVGRYSIEQRQQRLEGFVEMALAESALASRYPEDIWEGDWSLPNLKSLWLDKTLIEDWADVAAICELCPNLDWVSLSRTRFKPVAEGGRLPAPAGAPAGVPGGRLVLQPFVCRVRSLVLNSTMVTWQDVLNLDAAGVFPHLEHLHLAQNNLSEGIPESLAQCSDEERRPLHRLRSLNLDSNGISDWRVLQRAVTAFPALEALHLNSNLLGGTLEGLAEAAADQTPRRLTALFLSENRLGSWRAVGALASYAVLELKAQRIPLTEAESPVASPMLLRQIIIALMPTLMRLNASEVTVKERTAAERYFLSLYQQGQSKVIEALGEGCSVEAHATRLRGVHGDVVGGDVTEEAQASRSALQHALVEVTLRPIGVAILDQAPVKKRVPHTMTVAELKRLAQSLFKQVPLPRICLQLADSALPFGVPLDDEARELGFYGVGDGTEIRVDDAADASRAKA